MTVRPDGTIFIYNERPEHRARRTSGRLMAVPSDELDRLIRHYAQQHRLEERLVRAIVQVESGYNPRARSVKGAQGLMQLMPATARSLAVEDPYDPAQNLMGGTAYLRSLLDRYGNLRFALAAYNAGPTAVDRYGGIPPYRETQRYVTKVLGLVESEGGSASAFDASDDGPRPEIFVSRDENNRLVFSTEPPGGR
ncbi:MAG: lytic transglycosylase domain-containing protein [Acidobacteriota bacterium]